MSGSVIVMSVDVALVQLDVSGKPPSGVPDPKHQIERARAGVADAADVDVVVLPELWMTGAFSVPECLDAAQPADGPFVELVASLAEQHRIWLHGGSFLERADDGRLFNTAVLAGPDGSIAAMYRKIHLFGFDSGEAALLSAGDQVVVVETPLGPTGLATCYDLRFPEMFRALTDAGATSVLLSSGWPAVRVQHWTLLATARAVENQLWMLGCNNAGEHSGVPQGGRSLVVDPRGAVVAEADAGPQILRASIDPDAPASTRASFPVLRDRRLRG